MLPTDDDCDECVPDYLRRNLDSVPPMTIAVSLLPFAITFLAVAFISWQRLLPHFSSSESQDGQSHGLPSYRKESAKSNERRLLGAISIRRLAAIAFSISLALSAVLAELIVCEISNLLNPAARGFALKITLFSLLVLIVIITPTLEAHLLVSGSQSSENAGTKRKARLSMKYVAEALFLGLWFLAFWYIPLLPATLHKQAGQTAKDLGFVEACLERIGIIGISLMASLAGFAAVSSIWQTFGVRQRPVREADISRKENGLSATRDMLATKQSRLRALQRKMADAPSDSGFMTRMMGSIRGNADTTEQRALEMEISGLETMSMSLSSSLSTLQSRFNTQQRSRSTTGRFLNTFEFGFALYCLYRIAATSFSSLRRWWQPDTTFATSDPINNILALLTTHYDPTLDREAWSRQISFALSAVMLLASLNSVLQTSRLFARFLPTAMQRTQTTLPLIISQIAGTYVISSALLLRSNLPDAYSSVITEALGAPLEGRFVEGWFESWFLVAVGLTSTGILVGRKMKDGDWDDWDDGAGDMEMGKMN